jgi:hypothetical protein
MRKAGTALDLHLTQQDLAELHDRIKYQVRSHFQRVTYGMELSDEDLTRVEEHLREGFAALFRHHEQLVQMLCELEQTARPTPPTPLRWRVLGWLIPAALAAGIVAAFALSYL